MSIYLDTCCYCRPWDDQLQPRIRKESDTIRGILRRSDGGFLTIVGSRVLVIEIGRISDPELQSNVAELAAHVHETLEFHEAIYAHAKIIEANGIQSFDAMHLAFAHAAHVDIFITTDDSLCKRARKEKTLRPMIIGDPLESLTYLKGV